MSYVTDTHELKIAVSEDAQIELRIGDARPTVVSRLDSFKMAAKVFALRLHDAGMDDELEALEAWVTRLAPTWRAEKPEPPPTTPNAAQTGS